MNTEKTASPQGPAPTASAPSPHGAKESLPVLMLGAIGVVYGDIGTSPLYALKESFIGPHPLAVILVNVVVHDLTVNFLVPGSFD